MKNPLRCEQCQSEAPWLVQADSKWVGPCHVPAETWDLYPGWRQAEDLRIRRAVTARANFGKTVAA